MAVTVPGKPPVEAWGFLFGEPDCSLWIAGPGGPVIATLAETLGQERLRVQVAADGRSIKAKTGAISFRSLVHLVGQDILLPSVMTLVIAEEGPPGTRIDITVRGDDTRVVRYEIPRALSHAVNVLEHRGMRVNVGPWQPRPRRPRRP